MNLVDCKSALIPPVVYTADRSNVVALTLCSFVAIYVYEAIYNEDFDQTARFCRLI